MWTIFLMRSYTKNLPHKISSHITIHGGLREMPTPFAIVGDIKCQNKAKIFGEQIKEKCAVGLHTTECSQWVGQDINSCRTIDCWSIKQYLGMEDQFISMI